MSEAKLNLIVKGAPSPNTTLPAVASSIAANPPSPALAASVRESQKPVAPRSTSDPLSTLPGAPPQIYLNLLILEASLRSQYVALRARRRQHTFFLLLLALWNVYFSYALFLRPREDGKGHGGSVYWVLDMYEKVSFLGGLITAILIWATGQWERGLRWPRRWVAITNRGLRTVNLKLVVLKGPWWIQLLSSLSILLPHKSFFISSSSSWRYVPVDMEKRLESNSAPTHTHRSSVSSLHRESNGMHEEDLTPGGDHIKLLLLPKHFSADFRQNWETYRNEYWEAENGRRAELRKALRTQQLDRAKVEGGRLWWARYRGWRVALSRGRIALTGSDVEKVHHHAHQHSSKSGKDASGNGRKSRLKDGFESTNSRSSSLSSSATTGTPEPVDDRERRPSLRKAPKTSAPSSSAARGSRRSTSDLEDPESPAVRQLRERAKDTSDERDSGGTRGGDSRPERSTPSEATAHLDRTGEGNEDVADPAVTQQRESVASRTRQRDLVMSDEEGN